MISKDMIILRNHFLRASISLAKSLSPSVAEKESNTFMLVCSFFLAFFFDERHNVKMKIYLFRKKSFL